MVLMCPLEEKELLIAAAPEIYFETDHYKGWPAILVRIHAIATAELALRHAFVDETPLVGGQLGERHVGADAMIGRQGQQLF